MSTMCRRRWWGGVLVAVLVGCSNDSPPNNPYPTRDEGQNTLYSSFEERPKHLDPAVSYASNEYTFIGQIYEPPFQYHYLKRPYTLVPLTATAMPTPSYLNAEGQTVVDGAGGEGVAFSVYEIRIRPGIRYQPHPAFARDDSGQPRYDPVDPGLLRRVRTIDDFPVADTRELTADDYVYQIKRLAHPKTQSPIFGFMAEYIVGLRELGDALAAAQEKRGDFLDLRDFPLAGAEVVDRYTYRIKIIGKYPQFLYWLAMPFFSPIPPEADRFYSQPGLIEKNITLDWYPVGTGPYRLTVNNPNRQMVMERNPNFHGEVYPDDGDPDDGPAGFLADAGAPLPFIDRVVFSLEKESIPVWTKFLQGYYDASGISSESFDQAVNLGAGGDAEVSAALRAQGIRLRTSTAATTYYTGFNMLDPVVGGAGDAARKLRQAIAIAIDEEESIAIFRNGRGTAMQGPIPPGIFGFTTGAAGINAVVYDWVDGQPKRKGIETARRLLADAGYPNGRSASTGEPLILNFDTAGTGPESKASFDWLHKQFAKIDLQLVIRNTDYNRFQEKMQKGMAQIFEWGWNADYPDPENFLFLLYGPNAKAGKNGENATNYANAAFDRAFERMRNLENGAERQALIDEMVAIVRHDTPWAAGFHPKQFALYHAWYGNVKPNLMAHNTIKYIKIDPVLRAASRRKWNRPVVWPVLAAALALTAAAAPAVVAHRRRERTPPKPGAT